MRCVYCSTENAEGNRFCTNCGRTLAAPEPEPYTDPDPAPGFNPDPAPYSAPDPIPYEGPDWSSDAAGNTAPEPDDSYFRPTPPIRRGTAGDGSGGVSRPGHNGRTGRAGKKAGPVSPSRPSYGNVPRRPAAAGSGGGRGGRGVLPYILIGVLALALIGGGLYFFLGRDRPADGAVPVPIPIQTSSPASEAAAETTPDVQSTPAQQPSETPEDAAGAVHLSSAQLEDSILRIRGQYNDIMSAIAAGSYSSRTQDDVTMYFDGNEVKCVEVPANTNGSTYSRFFYFDQGRLIFAYYEGKDAHRLYFQDDVMIRWRYCTDKDQPDAAENYDQLETEAYRAKQDQVLEDARRFHP